MTSLVKGFRSQSKPTKMDSGKALSVYDGRKWPVVKCGAVYVTDEDKTKTVTKNVISLSSSSEEKKKQKSSKYTVAIGSSFGHVHSFLKDNENVLTTYEKTKAEDKCLLLIRKPKSASKQMLKAHSWADVSVDMHLRQPDGSFKQDQYKAFKEKFKKKSDLSLPPDELDVLANQSSRTKGQPANQKLSSTTLSSVETSRLSSVKEGIEDSKSDVILHSDLHGSSPNLSNSYPYIRKGPKTISQSLADLTQSGQEINNNKTMGGVLSQGRSQGHGQGRPQGPPPSVPQRTTNGVKKSTNSFVTNIPSDLVQNNTINNSEVVGNRPDVISNANIRTNSREGIQEMRNSADSRVKHDSGFHSEAPLSSDETYDNGFKQDLSQSTRSGGHVTSSPKVVRKEQKNVGNRNVHGNNSNYNQSSGISYLQNRGNVVPKSNGSTIQSGEKRVDGVDINRHPQIPEPQVPESVHYQKTESVHYPKPVHRNRSAGSIDNNKSAEKTSGVVHQPRKQQEPVASSNGESSQRVNKPHQRMSPQERTRHHEKTYSDIDKRSPMTHQPSASKAGERPRSSDKLQQRYTNDSKQRKSLGDVQENSVLMFDNKDPVIKAHSLGDLTTGCTFSLVGKKHTNISPSNQISEFTGTQLMKHIRNYREMTQNGNGGSLPFRGKALDDMDSVNQYYQQTQYGNTKGGNLNNGKMKHYGSLQHLPMTDSNSQTGQQSHPQPVSVRNREKTPMKPRRSLPQPPGDVHEKKRQITDMVKSRMSVDSNSTSPSSGHSNRAESIEPRPGGISATPSVSDREVSELLLGTKNDFTYSAPGVRNVCNNNLSKNPASYLPPSYSDTIHNNTLRKSGSFGSHDHGVVVPPGGRLSESGQTTLTSQSTIDSGYITNDPDPDTLSTSNYAKSIKQSAQNIYNSNQLFKQSKGDHHQRQSSKTNGDKHNTDNTPSASNQYIAKQSSGAGNQGNVKPVVQSLVVNPYNAKQAKESHTRTWVENHPGTYMSEHLKLNMNGVQTNDVNSGQRTESRDKNNNRSDKHPDIPENSVTELDLTQNVPPPKPARVHHQKPLTHHKSELSSKDIERMNNDSGQFTYRSKGKSISMAQGLNLIANNSTAEKGSFLSKTQPKFTGSLKDLIGNDKQIVPIETLRLESSHSTSTLPGSWKFQAQTRPESSLKFFGKPSLFQLLQNYNLYAVRIRIPDNFVIAENVRLIECEVVLPSPWIYGKDLSSPLSPKGSYAKLGGPNSAFRPVSAISTSPIKSVSMVTIMEISSQLIGYIESGQLQKGDLIIEVNERLMMGEELPTLMSVFHACQGELLLTVARDTARDTVANRDMNSSSPTDEDFRRMEQKINELTTELRKKDRTLKQLNSLLPWKLPSTKGSNSEGKDQDGYVCSLSEDEFIV